MESVSDRLADVSQRIADCRLRIAEQQDRIAYGDRNQSALAMLVLNSATSVLAKLLAFEARLRDLEAGRTSHY
jgi:hypothetical protein